MLQAIRIDKNTRAMRMNELVRSAAARLPDRKRSLETSLVLTTAGIALWAWTDSQQWLWAALALGLTGIFLPPLAAVLAWAWFGLAELLGAVMSRLLLSLVFFALVTPVGLWRRLRGKDSLRLRPPEKSNWIERTHTFSAADLEKTF